MEGIKTKSVNDTTLGDNAKLLTVNFCCNKIKGLKAVLHIISSASVLMWSSVDSDLFTQQQSVVR